MKPAAFPERNKKPNGQGKRKDASEIISRLSCYVEKISVCREKRDLLRIEAGAGRIYFLYYTSLFDSKYGFISRNGGGIKTGNRYASDVINALLNYGYSVLAAEIANLGVLEAFWQFIGSRKF